jgi:hypothetical protein
MPYMCGGSVVRVSQDPRTNPTVSVGPDSVGHSLLTEGKVFGGKTPTATNIVIAGGQCTTGNAQLSQTLAPHFVSAA